MVILTLARCISEAARKRESTINVQYEVQQVSSPTLVGGLVFHSKAAFS